jgi:hypothetical protein
LRNALQTYNVNHQVPDSAGTGTAFLCGVKANYGTLGVTHKVQRGDCDASLESAQRVESILKWFQEDGRSTGIVTTARLTHATPGAGYAKTSERNWESDKDIDESQRSKCKDIAAQLVEDNGFIQVRDARCVSIISTDHCLHVGADGWRAEELLASKQGRPCLFRQERYATGRPEPC